VPMTDLQGSEQLSNIFKWGSELGLGTEVV